MANINEIKSEFQFCGYKVDTLNVTTYDVTSNGNAIINMQLGYELEDIESDKEWLGRIELATHINAKDGDLSLFNIELIITGQFRANRDGMNYEQFHSLHEVNGLTVLTQMVRSYLLSVTSLWGIGEPIILPMINIHELISKKHKEDK